MVNPNLHPQIIPSTELIEGIPVIRACPLLFGRPSTYPNTLGPLAQKLKRSSNARAGPKEALDQMYKVDSFIKESQQKTPLGNRECRCILCMLYANGNGRHDTSYQEGLQMAPVFLEERQSVSILHKHITTRRRTKIPNSLKASASRK